MFGLLKMLKECHVQVQDHDQRRTSLTTLSLMIPAEFVRSGMRRRAATCPEKREAVVEVRAVRKI